ncbi:MAG: helix-turn-helix domain-containing protein [Shewanella sp.]
MKANICGYQIKKLREDRGWGQVELAAALNVDHGIKIEQSDISEIERRIRGVKDFELKAFASVFGVSADWLLEATSSD